MRVTAFEFYDDPVAHTSPSTCTINWAATTVAYPGVAGVLFDHLPTLVTVVDELADQNVADFEATIQRNIYKADGGLALAVTATPSVLTGTMSTVSPGTIPMSIKKVKDLMLGLTENVIDTL